ncbi:hypothetical protein ACQ4M4_09570 [Leptolyngbya sp. AN02str]|uniref:hypothetical protein n=1 Tax=Leptolyngbya sp. AN02str TaxID=3423363 RepID=UPI003D316EF3
MATDENGCRDRTSKFLIVDKKRSSPDGLNLRLIHGLRALCNLTQPGLGFETIICKDQPKPARTIDQVDLQLELTVR